MNFQVTVLKILVACPDGFAVMEDSRGTWRSWRPAVKTGRSGPGASRRGSRLLPGDIVATGSNHRGLNPFMDGDTIELETEGPGRLKLGIKPDLRRS